MSLWPCMPRPEPMIAPAAHQITCTFAVQRGVDPSILTNLLDEMTKQRQIKGVRCTTDAQRAVVKLAHGISMVPLSMTNQAVKDIHKFLSSAHVEWIVAVVALMGFLNKVMDGLGIPVEADVCAETVDIMDKGCSINKAGAFISLDEMKWHPPPPQDGWWLILSSLCHKLRPSSAMHLDKKLSQGVPTDSEECTAFLQKHTGCEFQMIAKLPHEKMRRATVALICKMFQDHADGLGVNANALAALQFCEVLENECLREDLVTCGKWAGVLFQDDKPQLPSKDERSKLMMLKVAKALSCTPSRTMPKIVNEIKAMPAVTASNLVELVSFLTVVQMLHRIAAFQEMKSASGTPG